MPKENESLNDILREINKEYGQGTIMKVTKDDERATIDSMSTGCYSLDEVFGCGGMPRGRIIDITGSPSSGKSSMAMFIASVVQKNGGTIALIDAEFSFVSSYAESLGVKTKELILVQPDHGEMAFDILEKLINSNELDLIIVDSTAALVPKKELEGEIEDSNIALQARLMSKGLRMITGAAAKTKTTVIFISQLRDKINSFVGPATDSTGGKAIKFYSSVRLKVDKRKAIKDKDEVTIGNRLIIEATKNKVGMPSKKAEIDLYFGKGIDIEADILDVATNKGIIKKSGNTYLFGGEKLGTSRAEARNFLEANKEACGKIKELLK